MKNKTNINSLKQLRVRKNELAHENEKLNLKIENDLNEIKFSIQSKFSTIRAIASLGKAFYSSFSSHNKSGILNRFGSIFNAFISDIRTKFQNGRKQSI